MKNMQLTVVFPAFDGSIANQDNALRLRGLLLGAGFFVVQYYCLDANNQNKLLLLLLLLLVESARTARKAFKAHP